jgi:hypothetical protein
MDFKNNIMYNIEKHSHSGTKCVYQDLNLPNPFHVDSFKGAQFNGYSLVNETFAAVISNVLYTDYNYNFTIAMDAYSEALASVEYVTKEGNLLATVTKYIEGEQPDNVFKPPPGMSCEKSLSKIRRMFVLN